MEIPVSSALPLVSHSIIGLDVNHKAGGEEIEEIFEVRILLYYSLILGTRSAATCAALGLS